MEPRQEVNKCPKPLRKEQKLQIVKLEERIAPKIATNHNETVVREPAKAKPRVPKVRREQRKPRRQIVKLEERIAPRITGNHNEMLVRDCSTNAR
jgi:hypothetical protein